MALEHYLNDYVLEKLKIRSLYSTIRVFFCFPLPHSYNCIHHKPKLCHSNPDRSIHICTDTDPEPWVASLSAQLSPLNPSKLQVNFGSRILTTFRKCSFSVAKKEKKKD